MVTSIEDDDQETCWICLEGVEAQDQPSTQPAPLRANRLIQPCKCPRVVHSVCLAKWQLSQSGRSEEKFCRFCGGPWPDWQSNLALPGMAAVEPVMSVHFNGQTHMVKVRPGEDGRVAFISDVRRLLRLRDNQEFSITFECKVPGHGMFLDLKGLSSYDAAVFCAAMTAVERQRLAAQRAQKASAATAATATSPSAAGAVPSGGASSAASATANSSVPNAWADPLLLPLPRPASTTAANRRSLDAQQPTAPAAPTPAAPPPSRFSSSAGSELLMSDADIEHLPSPVNSGSSLAASELRSSGRPSTDEQSRAAAAATEALSTAHSGSSFAQPTTIHRAGGQRPATTASPTATTSPQTAPAAASASSGPRGAGAASAAAPPPRPGGGPGGPSDAPCGQRV
ncbi:hypothetical protein GPECTOR_12g342 [Gonium pectorale]|uniref:RING-CH-type domain-containing protein n=1 Tax=Gonium pectorale TaxID=33097 RepID=A0A150GPW2_GONPE|nr:hypothetical protein GPECTOR_12g342 [Gonium pectorale]|eukprot:KXZ51380.1 hypothetical protein GPECTOR_12g342 [Gonium pectorale]